MRRFWRQKKHYLACSSFSAILLIATYYVWMLLALQPTLKENTSVERDLSLFKNVSVLTASKNSSAGRHSGVEGDASVLNQAGRRLLAAQLNGYWNWSSSQSVHTTYIKLQGVDSVGSDMFIAYGATVDQLKTICTSIEDCEGFNSEGWVKSRINSKKRATIDLYLKLTSTENRGMVVLEDSDAGVFQNHLIDYSKMEKDLKIYMYDLEIGQNMPSLKDYKYGVEYFFISLLAKSKFRTMNPKEATFFFLPSRCTAYRKSVTDLSTGVDIAANVMERMVEQVKVRFPFWNETLGTDHFYICAHDMGTEVVKSSDPDLWKNAIGLVNTADYSEALYVPHKDISLPPHPGRGTINWPLIGEGGVNFDPTLRTRLAFMAGHPGRGPVRPKIYELFSSDGDFSLVHGYISDEKYIQALKTTKFCLCPRGNKAWSPRLMDALWFGCIPVLIADYYVPPGYGLIPWQLISVSVAEKDVGQLKKILLSISEDTIRAMQLNIQRVYQHLTWNDPPVPYDAFHLVLYQLWQKKNIRRTHYSSRHPTADHIK